MSTKKRVQLAVPYRPGEIDEEGKVSHYMLLRQYQFPDTYNENEKLYSWDTLSALFNDYDSAQQCFEKHKPKGPRLGDWMRTAENDKVLAFLKEFFFPSWTNNSTAWSGYRVLGPVKAEGIEEFYFVELFMRDPEGSTILYDDHNAPNVVAKDIAVM